MNLLTFFKRLSLLLGFLNLVLLTLFLLPPPPHPGTFRNVVIHDLALNQEQQQQYLASAARHRAKMNELERQMNLLVHEYFKKGLIDSDGDDRKVLIKQIQKLEAEKITFTYIHFEELKTLCNEDQRKRYPRVLQKAIEILLIRNR